MEPLALFSSLLVLYCGYVTYRDLIRTPRKSETVKRESGRLGQAVLLRPNLASSRTLMSAMGGGRASTSR